MTKEKTIKNRITSVGEGLVSAQRNKINKNVGACIARPLRMNQGITLIALIISIIILLILSGVVLNLTLGERGIFNTAKDSKKQYIISEMKEELALALNELQLQKIGQITLDDVNQEWADSVKLIEYQTKIQKNDDIEGKIAIMQKDGIMAGFIIDENFKIIEDETVLLNGNYFKVDLAGLSKEINYNGKNIALENESYTATLSTKINSGEILDEITIKMNGNDITNEAYSNNVINIAKVSGNIEIVATTAWDGVTISTRLQGNGTETSPYLINNGSDLAYMAKQINEGTTSKINNDDSVYAYNAHYKLTNTIKLNKNSEWKKITDFSSEISTLNNWTPIAYEKKNQSGELENPDGFTGVLDGDYFTVKNIYIYAQANVNSGLFGRNSGLIKNLVVNGNISTTNGAAGGLTRVLRSSGQIHNCINNVNITVNGNQLGGGICAIQEKGSVIKECVNAGNISVNNNDFVNVGGITGNSRGTIINSYNNGNTSASGVGNTWNAGIVGVTYGNVKNVYNIGKIGDSVFNGEIIGEWSYSDGTSQYYYTHDQVPTASILNSNSSKLGYGDDVWVDDVKDSNGNWKYNNGYPILKWMLNIK